MAKQWHFVGQTRHTALFGSALNNQSRVGKATYQRDQQENPILETSDTGKMDVDTLSYQLIDLDNHKATKSDPKATQILITEDLQGLLKCTSKLGILPEQLLSFAEIGFEVEQFIS